MPTLAGAVDHAENAVVLSFADHWSDDGCGVERIAQRQCARDGGGALDNLVVDRLVHDEP